MENVKFTGILFFWMAFAAVNASTFVPCDDCTDIANTSVLAAIELILFPGNTVTVNYTEYVANAVALLDYMDLSKPTIVYTFGWTESSSSTSVNTIFAAYCSADSHNVILLNWEKIAAENYFYAAGSVNGIGYTVAKGLSEMVAAGLNSSTLQLVGHSLGAQISGYIGRYADFSVARITGLDPAGPFFTQDEDHLSSTDAQFVEIIHTNPGCAGINYTTGHVDFWPNVGSSTQPGCESDSAALACSCSHARSWKYYIEAFVNGGAFVGLACESASEFEAGSCSGNTMTPMGSSTPTTASGDFDLQTNSASPFGRGLNGTTYYADL